MAMMIKLGSEKGGGDEEFIVCARCDGGTWRQVETIGDRETIDCQFGGSLPWTAGRELTFRIPGIVTLKTAISPHGNWSFVYSDPQGRPVMGTSVVDGDFRPPESY